MEINGWMWVMCIVLLYLGPNHMQLRTTKNVTFSYFEGPCYEIGHCWIEFQSFDRGIGGPQNPNPNNRFGIMNMKKFERKKTGILIPKS